MDQSFFAAIRKQPFRAKLTQKQVDGFITIGEAWNKYGDGDSRKLAYILATVYHETGRTFQPVTEGGTQAYLKGKKYWPFIGRGYVQLTWKANYADWSKRLGVDLVKNPDLAKQPQYAARILVEGMMLGTFTKKKLADYINGLACDFKEARRVVNGTDKAALIAGYAASFLAALPAKPVAPAKPIERPVPSQPVPAPAPMPPAPPAPRERSYKPVIVIAVLLAALIIGGALYAMLN